MTRNKQAFLKILLALIVYALCLAGTAQIRESGAESYGFSLRADIDVTQLAKKIHAMINKERAMRGLSALSWNESLSKVARNYSQNMAQSNFFSHQDPEGRSFYDRYKAEGFQCRIRVGNTTCMGAENISRENLYSSSIYIDGKRFFNWKTEDEIAGSVVKRWMNSSAHRTNILTPYFKRQGIGVAFSDDGKAYITENFC